MAIILQGPIDSKGYFRRRQCSYLIDKTVKAIELTCIHELNLGHLCCFKNCPILTVEERDAQVKLRNELIHTKPSKENPKISFPDWYKEGRIEISRGYRIIDWNGIKWDVFIKEGVRWEADTFSDDDYEALYDALN